MEEEKSFQYTKITGYYYIIILLSPQFLLSSIQNNF